jgi:hypothetical protein
MTKVKKITIALWVMAAVVLLASLGVFAYSLIPKGDTNKVVVCGKDYPWGDIYDKFPSATFDANGKTYSGVKLSLMVKDSGQLNPETHKYKMTGSDGYEKTVTWPDIESGYLVKDDKVAIFPGLTKSFWVKDLITVEAI